MSIEGFLGILLGIAGGLVILAAALLISVIINDPSSLIVVGGFALCGFIGYCVSTEKIKISWNKKDN